MGALRVLIVDDEEDMRALLRSLIEIADHGLSVAGEAVDGDDALRQWRQRRPELVLLDQRMPGLSGLETAAIILSEDPDQSIIIFTAFMDDDIRRMASELGVRECVSKTDAYGLIKRLRDHAAG